MSNPQTAVAARGLTKRYGAQLAKNRRIRALNVPLG